VPSVTALAQRSTTFLREVRAITVIVIVLGIMIGLMDWMFSKILIDLFGRIFG